MTLSERSEHPSPDHLDPGPDPFPDVPLFPVFELTTWARWDPSSETADVSLALRETCEGRRVTSQAIRGLHAPDSEQVFEALVQMLGVAVKRHLVLP